MSVISRLSAPVVVACLALVPGLGHARDHHHGKTPPPPEPAASVEQAPPRRHDKSTGEPKSEMKSETKAPALVEEAAPTSARQVVQRESHIEFDERLVQGQTAAGAIYLFQRGESEFRSMVKLPDSFRDRSVKPILPQAKP